MALQFPNLPSGNDAKENAKALNRAVGKPATRRPQAVPMGASQVPWKQINTPSSLPRSSSMGAPGTIKSSPPFRRS